MFLPGKTQSHNLTKEEWEAMCNVVEDQSLIINPAYKSSRVGIWDREDYIAEGYRQRNDHSTYTDVKKFNQKLMFDLTDKINKIFKDLCNKKFITEKELEYWVYTSASLISQVCKLFIKSWRKGCKRKFHLQI